MDEFGTGAAFPHSHYRAKSYSPSIAVLINKALRTINQILPRTFIIDRLACYDNRNNNDWRGCTDVFFPNAARRKESKEQREKRMKVIRSWIMKKPKLAQLFPTIPYDLGAIV